MLPFLVFTNLKMLVRDRQALFWALFFPLIFVGIFGLFDLDNPPNTEVTIIDRAQDNISRRLIQDLEAIENVDVESRIDEADAREEIRDGDVELLLIIPPNLAENIGNGVQANFDLVFDESDPSAARGLGLLRRFLDQQNLRLVDGPSVLNLAPEGVRSEDTDYFDFLLPGLVGMGIMNYSIIGLASVLAQYRNKNIFKRILTTPLSVRTFFGGLILSYLVLSLIQAAVILAAGVFLLGGSVHGQVFYLGVLVLMGNVVFLNIGFIVGAHVKTVAAASGMGNAVALPMMFLSGTFFPIEDLPRGLASVVEFLPLAPMLEAMRGVSLDSKAFWEFPRELAILAGWIVGTSLVAMRLFRFRQA
jgi:ABC-2 type transport system permease protein